LVLLGAQKLLFNNGPSTSQANPPEQASEQASAPVKQSPPTPDKPSPVGENPTPAPSLSNDTAKPGDPTPAPARSSQPPTQASSAGERTIQLLTDPPGATIQVDGDAARSCKTPCMLSLPAGRHTMTTQLDGYRPYPRVINVPQEGDQFLKLAKTVGTLSVTSSPPGATIQLNGEAQPQKTPASFNIAPGTYHVRVTREGVPLDFDVEIKDGEFQNRNVNFQ